MLLGCIADDYTGATDLANMLVRAGLRTTLWFDAAQLTKHLPADAVVVALKTALGCSFAGRVPVARGASRAAATRCEAIFFQVLLHV